MACDPIDGCADLCEGVRCPNGELCSPLTGECRPQGLGACEPCQVDAECGGDGACLRNQIDETFCAPACQVAADCDAGYDCANVQGADTPLCVPTAGTCVERCAGVRCGNGEACNPLTGACVAACMAQADCPRNQYCDRAEGCQPTGSGDLAMGAQCDSDDQCAAGLVCADVSGLIPGLSCATPCDVDNDCAFPIPIPGLGCSQDATHPSRSVCPSIPFP
jgi:hypothetical protein